MRAVGLGLGALLTLGGCSTLPGASDAPQLQLAPSLLPSLSYELVPYAPEPLAPADLWERLRRGYTLPELHHPRIISELNWFVRHPDYLERTFTRAEPYLHFAVTEAERRGIPLELALLPVVESAFDPFAFSPARASGLWQFMPATGRLYGLQQDWWHDERRDILKATEAAYTFLEDMHGLFEGDWLLALAAYNSGSGNVRKAQRRNQRRGKPLDFFSLDLPRETEAYVPKLLAIARLVRDPEAYELALHPLPNAPQFAVVETGGQLDLARAADLAGVDMETLYRLNPALNRWSTHPDGPHRLLLPVDKVEAFRTGLATLDASQRVAWVRHIIREGESLSVIAARYHSSVEALRRANQLRGNIIRAGDALLVPRASATEERYALSADQRKQRSAPAAGRGTRFEVTVRPGDSLWTLARAYGTSTANLARWNGMRERDVLRVGRSIVVYQEGPAPTALDALPPQRSAVSRRVAYRVRQGDSLARIAKRYRVTVADIVGWNALDPEAYLQPGQPLTLFVAVTAVN